MTTLKKKIKIVLGLVTIGVLFVGTVFGILTRENGSKIDQKQKTSQEKQDYYSDNQEIQEKRLVCSQLLEEVLEEDENDLVFSEYAEVTPVECMSVGCGGFF